MVATMYIPSDKKIWAELTSDKYIQGLKFWSPAVIATIIPYLLIALNLERSQLSQSIAELSSTLIPAAKGWGEGSMYPHAIPIHMFLCWMIIPAYTFLFSKNPVYERSMVSKWLSYGKMRHGLPLLSVLVTSFFVLLFFYFNPPQNQYLKNSIPFIIIYNLCSCFAISSCLSLFYFWLKNFREIHL